MANRERPPESERRRGRAAPRRTARDFDDRESTSFVPGRDELTQKPARTLAGGGRGIEAPRYAETQALAVGPRRLRLDSHAAPGLSGRTAERYGYPPRPGDLPEREAAPPSFSRTPPLGQRCVTVLIFVQKRTPSVPCWLTSPKAERFQPPKV